MKKIQKISIVLLVLAFIVSGLVACGSQPKKDEDNNGGGGTTLTDQEKKFVGTWKGKSTEQNGEGNEITVTTTYVFSNDKKFTQNASSGGESEGLTGTWAISGNKLTLTFDSQEIPAMEVTFVFSANDTKLTITAPVDGGGTKDIEYTKQ